MTSFEFPNSACHCGLTHSSVHCGEAQGRGRNITEASVLSGLCVCGGGMGDGSVI